MKRLSAGKYQIGDTVVVKRVEKPLRILGDRSMTWVDEATWEYLGLTLKAAKAAVESREKGQQR
jgi:hypothetical protein